MKGKKNGSGPAGLILLIAGFVLAFAVRIPMKDRIIIQTGIETWRVLSCLPFLLVVLGGLLLLLALKSMAGSARSRRNEEKHARINEEAREKQQKAQAEKKRQELKKKKEDLRTPEGVYEYFEKDMSLSASPAAASCRKGILGQLDTMNALQSRLHRLIELNDISALSQAENLLQQVEDAMCRDCRAIINKYIALGLGEGAAAREEERSFEQATAQVMGNNDRKLQKAQELLNAVAEMANSETGSEDAGKMLEIYINTLKSEITKGDNFNEEDGISLTFGADDPLV